MCPTEFKYSVFIDGELPEAEARELAMHLDVCEACSLRVAALQGENRMLVQCLQDVDLLDDAVETVPEFQGVAEPISIGRFALGVVGVALAFRLSTGLVFGLELPPGWQGWVLNLGSAWNAAFFAIQNGTVALADAIQAIALIGMGGLVLAVMGRALKNSTAVGAILSVITAIGIFSSPSYAIDVRKGAAASVPAGEVVDDTLIVNPGSQGGQVKKDIDIAGTVTGDLLAAGDVIRISGTVEGNVVAVGRRVEISGTVGGSVFTAAPNVVIAGKVGGSVLAFGSIVEFSGEIARNLAGFGANFNMGKGALIGGNVALGSGDLVLDGNVMRDLHVFSGVMELRGNVRNVAFSGGQAKLTSTARVGGDFTAHVDNEKQVIIDPAAVIVGMKNIEKSPPKQSDYSRPGFYFWQIVRIITLFITGLIVFRLAPWFAATRVASGVDWLKAGGLGFAALVTVPIAAIIVACTVVGLPLALSSIAIWLGALYLAKIIVAEFVGRTVFKTSKAMSLLGGLVVVIVAVNLPFIGGLINFLFILLGLGALVLTLYRNTWRVSRVVEA
jgi:cytoskeletal protein CcmA (bactofilin family)